MAGVNKVILIGNLGADPEIKHLQNDVTVANFNIATTEYFKDKQTGERREQTEWHRIVAWRWHAQTAEKYLRKGSKVYIEGKLRSRQYQDKDGQTRYITEVVCDEMNMLDRPTTDGGAGQGAGQAPAHQAGPTSQPVTSSSSAPTDNDTDDLPF
ncbi:MAG: single-stranded DNA-binding protein [Flavobacteriales bacterium]|jgi:single-strand DNA-binding protein|nr:single-stranded DNA-binding protein [Flavobacteriales bacterium]MBK6549844.1 single-stranded DNA-binding protein [Flavobacteriales bacterium]MBK6883466.1 single-stranded DNA-binding protein [Flavobacteriales bacterium]MBK7102361.1 single-stranded DNA-binding protein [Flavobacteriales bacterium]MBK7113101.1 single-stranded DNA-binding protein [Flavobacteriales bacterium]